MIRARLKVLYGLVAPRSAEVDGLRLQLPPGVLDPCLFRTGAWFARHVAAATRADERLLDLGCGSGVVGMLAARQGAQVTAIDLDPQAVRAARSNGIADARQGDLFAPLRGERFDRICFNPPYLRGPARGRPYGRALYGGAKLELVARFAVEVRAHLAPGGEVWLAWSDRAPPAGPLLGERWALRLAEEVDDERLEIWTLGA